MIANVEHQCEFHTRNRFEALTEAEDLVSRDDIKGSHKDSQDNEKGIQTTGIQTTKGSHKQRMRKIKMKDQVFIGAFEDSHTAQKYLDVGFKFQVTDVKKPLLSVRRINEGGNVVQFGPEDQDNFIFSKQTRDKVPLRKHNGVYLLDVMFPDGSWSEITG